MSLFIDYILWEHILYFFNLDVANYVTHLYLYLYSAIFITFSHGIHILFTPFYV